MLNWYGSPLQLPSPQSFFYFFFWNLNGKWKKKVHSPPFFIFKVLRQICWNKSGGKGRKLAYFQDNFTWKGWPVLPKIQKWTYQPVLERRIWFIHLLVKINSHPNIFILSKLCHILFSSDFSESTSISPVCLFTAFWILGSLQRRRTVSFFFIFIELSFFLYTEQTRIILLISNLE